jgi:nitroimidazol reductase NimA-like FMN-containing flavoprotein (pyridoxamine 5'-phosphate oxidase superfamily)
MASISLTPEQVERLEKSEIIRMASVRPDGSPHLVPLWFVWTGDRAYICTPRRAVKSRNITLNRRVALALEDGSKPIIIEEEATLLDTIPATVGELFVRNMIGI